MHSPGKSDTNHHVEEGHDIGEILKPSRIFRIINPCHGRIRFNEDPSLQIAASESRRRILIDGSLQIINLDRYDGGTYVCTADNGLGPPVRAEYELVITGTYHVSNSNKE